MDRNIDPYISAIS